VLAAIALVIYTEFGRDVSIPFSVIMILVASLCIGFSIHMFLISADH
jgi:cell division protein FtsX